MSSYCKFYKEKQQVSYDNGVTWIDVSGATRKGNLIQRDSPDCGYTPLKLYATYSDSTTYTVDCNSSTTLSQTEVEGHSTPYSSMTSAEIGNCVTSIGMGAFFQCSSLINIDIPNSVTSIGEQAFIGCSSLTSIDIPNSVTSIGDGAFGYCTSLTSIDIPSGVTSIGNFAFMYCISLTNIDIPNSVTSIGKQAFIGCSSLTSIDIPNSVTSIGQSAFRDCTSLTSVTVNATTPPTLGTSAFDSANNCPIYVPCESVEAYKSASGWSDYASRIQGIEPCYSYSAQYLTFVAIDSGTFSFSGSSSGSVNNSSIQYSLNNGSTWNTLNRNAQSPTVSAGQKIMWKESLTPIPYYGGVGVFSSTGRFNIEGNIMSLLYSDNFSGQTSIVDKKAVFSCMFSDNRNVINTNKLVLPSTNLSGATYCYNRMFSGCTSLITAPELPATSLAGSCYDEMFAGCSSLTTAPELPATTLASRCYIGMFKNCTSLTTAPELPATTLEYHCYWLMFYNCTSLTTAPVLSATTLVEGCYLGMFRNCSSLNYIKCLATNISATDCTGFWLEDVSASGTFVKASSMSSWPSGVSGIPSGWTVQNA